MFKKAKVPPVIVLGMHRSGTSMISRFLEEGGIFFGHQKDDNNESLYFYKINYWIFRIGVSKPDYPHNLQYMSPECREVVLDGLDYYMHSIKRGSYIGNKNLFKYKDLRDIDFRWGWKEPKNTFTIDLWTELFPDAKIVHIYRNPMDCALSYIKRDKARRNAFQNTWKKKIKRFRMDANKYHQNFRLNELKDGYELWEEYVSKAIKLKEQFGDNIYTLKYEDFIDQPEKELKSLFQFTDLDISAEKIKSIVAKVDATKKYSFTNNPEAVNFYNSVKDDALLKALGYDNILG